MKFSDITKVAKRFRYAVIVTDAGNNQWCHTGAAAYKLEGLPYLTADDFLNIIGIAETKKCKWYLGDRQDEAGLFKIDRLGEQELTGDMAGVSILYNGHKLMPFYLAEGVVWLDVDLLVPVLNGKTEYLRFFLRNQNGRRTIAVKDGLVLIAVIGEFPLDQGLYEHVKLMWQQCQIQGVEVESHEDSDDDAD